MEERASPDRIALLDQGDAALADNPFEILDRLEIGIDQRFIDELPKVLGGLQLGAMGGLEDEPDAIGNGQIFWTVPACPVELKHDALVLASGRRFGEISKDGLEHLFTRATAGALLEPQTAFETFQTVAPLAGSTKPQT